MASTTDTSLKTVARPFPRAERRLQKQLRSTGQEYISRTGKIVPAKKVADVLCSCPQRCDERVSRQMRENLFEFFYGLADFERQNAFLRLHLEVRSRIGADDIFRTHKRVTCKYSLPIINEDNVKIEVCQKAFVNAFVITEKRARRVREKLFSNLGLTTYQHTNSEKNKQPKINVIQFPLNDKHYDEYPDSDTCESHEVLDPKDNPLVPPGIIVPEGVTIVPVTKSADHDRDIAIVNNFFSNQLWKPEYILSK